MKILTIDDHALFREGLRHLLQVLEEQVTVIEASNFQEALEHVSNHPDLDLVLLDLSMPGVNGFSVLETLTSLYPALPIVILSASNLHCDVQQAIELGAMGYILKDTTGLVMLNALRLILSGGVYAPPNTMLFQEHVQHDKPSTLLTPRQIDVLTLIAQGNSNKWIAAQLSLSEATIKMHVTAIMKNLGVSNRTEAAIKFQHHHQASMADFKLESSPL